MAFWYGDGTLHEYLTASHDFKSVPLTAKLAVGGTERIIAIQTAPSASLTPQQQAQAKFAKRTNATEAALISLKQASRDSRLECSPTAFES